MRFLEWHLYTALNAMGWPKPRGILRRLHVDVLLADIVVELLLKVIVGLGAGRPEVATRLLADTFSGNPWTEESTGILTHDLREEAENLVAGHPDMTPWKAIFYDLRLAQYGNNLRWQELFDDRVGLIRGMVAGRAAYWGLTNEHRMQAIFDKEKLNYDESASEANQYGLGVSSTFPFDSLDHFYEWCDTFVDTFNMAMPPLGAIPPQLRAVPEIARRLSA